MADSKADLQGQAGSAQTTTEFELLLKQEFKPKTEEANQAIQQAVTTLAEQLLRVSGTKVVSGDVVMREGEPTGALPGRLVRGAQPAPA